MLVSGRKGRLGYMMKTPHQSHSQNFCGDPRGVARGNGKLGCLSGKAGTSHVCMLAPPIHLVVLSIAVATSVHSISRFTHVGANPLHLHVRVLQ